MPHCIIEHSHPLLSDQLISLVFQGTLGSGLFQADGNDIKVRALAYDSYHVGGQTSDFVHVVIKLLSGRTSAQKRELSQSVANQLTESLLTNCSITVEIVEIDKNSYSKSIV